MRRAASLGHQVKKDVKGKTAGGPHCPGKWPQASPKRKASSIGFAMTDGATRPAGLRQAAHNSDAAR